ncbi:MAG: site-specific integrase [Sphaerochaetaceae bacterium]|nr:site-specific integrase [Sphaerochaetaceae bacterium]
MTFKKALEKYELKVSLTKSEGTYKYFLGKKNLLLKYIENIECDEIDDDIMLMLIKNLKDRNPLISNVTLNKYQKMVRQILKSSCKIELEIEKLPENKKVIQTIPQNIINRIYKYYSKNLNSPINIRNYLIFRLYNETGLRVNELVNLRLNDFDMQNCIILVKKTKTNNERYVFYTKETNSLLNRYIIMCNINNYVFINFKTLDRLTVDSIETIATRLRKRLDIAQSISPHKWRHSFATRFVRKNGNMEVLRHIMGHESLKTTQKYLHLDKDSLQEEYNRVNNVS